MKVKKMVYCALFAALLCGGILGKKYGTASVMVYILMGAAGVPVFSSLKGGLGVLAGPTGGYIVGYVFATFITGFFFEKSNKFYVLIPGMILGVLLCYAFGTAWYMFVSGAKFLTVLLSCVLPFLPLDFVKVILSCFVVKCVKRTGVLD